MQCQPLGTIHYLVLTVAFSWRPHACMRSHQLVRCWKAVARSCYNRPRLDLCRHLSNVSVNNVAINLLTNAELIRRSSYRHFIHRKLCTLAALQGRVRLIIGAWYTVGGLVYCGHGCRYLNCRKKDWQKRASLRSCFGHKNVKLTHDLCWTALSKRSEMIMLVMMWSMIISK